MTRLVLLALGLGVLALLTPPDWSWLWLAAPAATASALLLCWRFGLVGWLVPVALVAATLLLGGRDAFWAWGLPAAAVSGAWMGSREEHGAGPGQLAWMLVPALLLAAGLPCLPQYRGFVAGVDREFIGLMHQYAVGGDRLEAMRHAIESDPKARMDALANLLPSVLFVWTAAMVVAGRALASRLAGLLRWPPLRRAPLRDLRLPDGALWIFIAGLGLLLSPWNTFEPSAWTLLFNAGFAFCLQGMAVVESLTLARGLPVSGIVMTLWFVLALAMPAFFVAAAALGLSDVWLDYRRLETPHGDQA